MPDAAHSRPEVLASVTLAFLALVTIMLAVWEVRSGSVLPPREGFEPTDFPEMSSTGAVGTTGATHATGAIGPSGEAVWTAAPPLPVPVSNNAVAGLELNGVPTFFSFLGIDTTKVWSGVGNGAFQWTEGDTAWTTIESVPGPGRLASTAQVWRGRVYLFGGYTVAEDGSEASVPNVDVYDPVTRTWTAAAPMPVPVDDAVSGLWRDSLVVLVSGWHDTDNVADVQIYDPANDAWAPASPIPGPPVFGHAGAVAGDVILYRDGAMVREARPRFVLTPSAWRGGIDPSNPSSIAWTAEVEPGPALYRAAGAGIDEWILFAGGTDNAYNYNGIGYDGRPAEARSGVWAYHAPSAEWREGPALPVASMDHRALAVAGDVVMLAGGMDGDRRVTDRVWVTSRSALLAALEDARRTRSAPPVESPPTPPATPPATPPESSR